MLDVVLAPVLQDAQAERCVALQGCHIHKLPCVHLATFPRLRTLIPAFRLLRRRGAATSHTNLLLPCFAVCEALDDLSW
jgi:hypothetical protein